MAGKPGRSGRISNEEMRRRRIWAAKQGGFAKALVAEQQSDETPLGPAAQEMLDDANRLGIPVPETIGDALKLKQLLVVEEKRKKIQAEREFSEGRRVPIELVDDYLERVVSIFTRALDTSHRIFDEYTEFTDDQLVIIRRAIREWAESTRTNLSQEEIYERQHEHRGESTESRELGQSVEEAPTEVAIEED